jgi:hypothetical protein
LILINFGLDIDFRKSEVICPSGHFVAAATPILPLRVARRGSPSSDEQRRIAPCPPFLMRECCWRVGTLALCPPYEFHDLRCKRSRYFTQRIFFIPHSIALTMPRIWRRHFALCDVFHT